MATNNLISDEYEERVRNVACEIEKYLKMHPHASDSIEGIATWWVARQRIRDELEIVRAALEQLTLTGVISAGKSDDEHDPVYHVKNISH